MLGDRMIGAGTIDIDPMINFDENNMIGSQLLNNNKNDLNEKEEGSPLPERACRCKRKLFLSHGTEKVGYINIKIEFIEQPFVVIGLKFLYASLRRSSSFFTSMHVRVQVVAGEEVLSTQKHKDKGTKNPPSWEDEILMFNVPTSLKECLIRVLDDNIEIGRYKLHLSSIIDEKGEHRFTEQLESDHSISGVIKFIAMVGVTSIVKSSKKMLEMQENEERAKIESQTSLEARIEHPLEKESKIEDEAKTNFQTFGTSEQLSKNHIRPEHSILFNHHDERH